MQMRALDDERLASAIESVLLIAGEPINTRRLASILQIPATRLASALERLQRELCRGIRLQRNDGLVQLVSASENADVVTDFLGTVKPAPLSRPSLEALTVIAYHQPVTRAEIEATRGVNSDRAVQTLLARGLIEEKGHRIALGRPMEYGTTFGFLEYFGLSSLDDLPPLPERPAADNAPAELLGMRPGVR